MTDEILWNNTEEWLLYQKIQSIKREEYERIVRAMDFDNAKLFFAVLKHHISAVEKKMKKEEGR